MTATTAALVLGMLGAIPASADPSNTPTNSSEAKQAWVDAQRQAEAAAEQLNGAREDQTKAKQAADRAAADLTASQTKVVDARKRATAAEAELASYQQQLDAMVSASFRGAGLGGTSALFTATSADDFLDQAVVIDRVADDNRQTVIDAQKARTAAEQAQADAVSAEAAAAQAKSSADTASERAKEAAAAAEAKKTDLDKSVSTYKALYDKLSEKERQEAAAAAEKARQESEAAARRLAEQQAAAAAQASQSQTSQQQQVAAAAEPQSRTSTGQEQQQNDPTTTGQTQQAEQPKVSGGDNLGQIAAQAALTKVGGGYCYACDGPSSFDCSGLTTWAWAQAGISIPRTSYSQADFPEVPLDQLQPGDLVTYYSPVSHVAIYVGNGMVVSAADESLGILYVPVERAGPNATGHRVPR